MNEATFALIRDGGMKKGDVLSVAQVAGIPRDVTPEATLAVVERETRGIPEALRAETRKIEGIYYVRVWLNEGELQPGDDIMYVLVGGDIRPRVIETLQFIVGKLKSACVTEQEIYE